MATDWYVQNIWDGPESEHRGTQARCHDVSTTPPVLAAELAQAWADIQRYHPELPDLAAPESLIGESSSACGAELSFERLLHEAVHGIAAARGVRDTSRAAATTTDDSSRSPRSWVSTMPRSPTPAVASRWSRSTPRPSAATARRSSDCSAPSRRTRSPPPPTPNAPSAGRPHGTAPPEVACASRPCATADATSGSYRRSSPRRRSSAVAAESPSASRKRRSRWGDPMWCGTMASCTRQPHRNPLASG